jgi:hypothetical protein
MAIGPMAALTSLMLVAISFFALTHAYVVSDFSVVNVVENSHSLKPMLYKITGVWGNHEGSMLLWVLILADLRRWSRCSAAICPHAEGQCAVGSGLDDGRVPAFHRAHLQPVRVLIRRRPKARTSTRSCRTSASRSIRRCSISAMSAFRFPSPLPSPR